jgi:arylsulfatase A-like enzyme
MSSSRRDFLATLAAPLVAAPPSRPNIVLILADDLGYECLGCNGGTSYRTPNLDALAGAGIRFTQAHAQPLCTPTRTQLMTGKYTYRNWKAFGILDPAERTFGHIMKDAGYRTAMAGKWQMWSYNPPDYEPQWRAKGMKAEQSGFDEYCLWHTGHTEDKGSRYADPTIDTNGSLSKHSGAYGPDVYTRFLGDFMEKNREKPFFAYYSMALTHGPFNPTPRSADWAKGNRLKNDPKYFGDMVQYTDEVVGRIVRKLDDLKLRERTIILFYGDNGTDRHIQSRMGDRVVQGGKGLTTDAGTHVPMIANWKGTAPAGRVLDDLIDSVDFLPTMTEAAGASAPRGADGQSFLPQLQGGKGNPRKYLFCHYDPRPGWDKDNYTLHRFAWTKQHKLYDDGRMYDLLADPLEQHPLPPGSSGEARRMLQDALKRHQA